jgi:hypothetical protein
MDFNIFENWRTLGEWEGRVDLSKLYMKGIREGDF